MAKYAAQSAPEVVRWWYVSAPHMTVAVPERAGRLMTRYCPPIARRHKTLRDLVAGTGADIVQQMSGPKVREVETVQEAAAVLRRQVSWTPKTPDQDDTRRRELDGQLARALKVGEE